MTWAEEMALREVHGMSDADIERLRIRAQRIEESYEPDGALVYVWSERVMDKMARLEITRLAAKLDA